MIKHLIFLLCCCSSLAANDYLNINNYSEKNDIITEDLKGIRLVSDTRHYKNKYTETTRSVVIDGMGKEKLPSSLVHELQAEYIGKKLTRHSLLEMKSLITCSFKRSGRGVVSIFVPEQDITDSSITLVVVLSRVGKFTVKGNSHFSERTIKGAFLQKEGTCIDEKNLLNDLAWINQSPYLHVDALYVPGKRSRTTNIDLLVQDRFPATFTSGLDSTGTARTGRLRWFTGASYGNLFGARQTLIYQFTGSSSFSRFQAHTAEYLAPLPWKHTLKIFGGYSKSNARIKGFVDSSHAYQVSGRYKVPFKPLYNKNKFGISFGYDFKHSQNLLHVTMPEALPIIFGSVNLAQFQCGFDGIIRTGPHALLLDFDLYFSPFTPFSNQSDSSFARLRSGAKSEYIYALANASYSKSLKKNFFFHLIFKGQVASNALLPTEQLSLGGLNTVRGYPERVVSFDDAINLSCEIESPELILHLQKEAKLRIFLFTDFGAGYNIKAIPGELRNDWLLSVGPSIKIDFAKHLFGRFDCGYKLHRIRFDDGRNARCHFSIVGSF